MEHALERSCCRSFSHVIGNKMGPEGCITTTTAFQDVCLNTNVLEAALGTWHHLTDQQLQISNKSYRFIAYRQFISWIYGWLGKDVRKRIPSCVLNKIRQTFPAADDVYVPYSDWQFFTVLIIMMVYSSSMKRYSYRNFVWLSLSLKSHSFSFISNTFISNPKLKSFN